MSRFNDWSPSTVQVVPPTTPPAPKPVWPSCPNCEHSATGVYGKRHACRRCGWVEGQLV